MKVVCIDNVLPKDFSHHFTKNKIYDAQLIEQKDVNDYKNVHLILDDDGYRVYVQIEKKIFFMPLKEYRKRKLNKIL